ncbi:MAG: hypothetical protein ACI80P_001265 [Flavobacteriales bacterium]|jgi:hypothetical protein
MKVVNSKFLDLYFCTNNFGPICNYFGSLRRSSSQLHSFKRNQIPSEEACDRLDNDFDGDLDEGCGCADAPTQFHLTMTQPRL